MMPRKYHRNVDIYSLGLTYLAMIQGNKKLVPQIETPNHDSELFESVGQLIAQRIRFKQKPLEIIRTDELFLLETFFFIKREIRQNKQVFLWNPRIKEAHTEDDPCRADKVCWSR